jgi:hypothetical protein
MQAAGGTPGGSKHATVSTIMNSHEETIWYHFLDQSPWQANPELNVRDRRLEILRDLLITI